MVQYWALPIILILFEFNYYKLLVIIFKNDLFII